MSPSKDVNTYIQNELAGATSPNQAEKKQHLGILAERIQVLITHKDVSNTVYQTKFNNIISKKPGGQIKIHAHVPMKLKMFFIKTANQYNTPFTVVENEASTEVAIVYHFDDITHQSPIDISQIN